VPASLYRPVGAPDAARANGCHGFVVIPGRSHGAGFDERCAMSNCRDIAWLVLSTLAFIAYLAGIIDAEESARLKARAFA
jgi:hypothetical protein